MSAPTSSATIEFPAAKIDGEIRKLLEEEGVRFKPQVFGPNFELLPPAYDLDTEINEDGIFRLDNPEARYGQFEDLEEMFVKKGVPFDRESRPDWNVSAELRIFRPGDPPLDLLIPNDEDLARVVGKIREFLALDDAGEEAASNIRCYLDKEFPAYPPLTDWAKEVA
jgi:hypothetical protein